MNEMYTTLFDRIVGGKYAPETRLKEGKLAVEFGVSRTPVREVLRQLEQDGLIKIQPKRGASIYPFTEDDLEDIYEIRKSLELLALEISAPSLSLHHLMEIRGNIQKLTASTDHERHSALDADLHSYIIESSGRRRLIWMLAQLFRLIQRFRELGFRDPEIRASTQREHLELIDALCVRNVPTAREVLARHIQNSKIRILTKVIHEGE